MTRVTTEATCHSPALSALGLVEYLENDGRPTFVLDIDTDLGHNHDPSSSQPIYANDALRRNNSLFDSIKTLLDDPKNHVGTDVQALNFSTWLRERIKPEFISFHGLQWSSTCLRQRWIIVSGHRHTTPCRGEHCDEHSALIQERIETPGQVHGNKSAVIPTSLHYIPKSLKNPEAGAPGHSPSILAEAFGVKPSSHNLMVLGFDWASTPLGPIEHWPQVLRQLVPYMLNGLQPGIMTWGAERTMIYNEAYISLIKGMHPGALGTSARIVFGSMWDAQMEPEWRAVELHGAIRYENSQIHMDRSGFLEETYFTYSLTPLWDADGQCCGVDNRCFETTRQTVVEARMLSLLKISESATAVTSLNDFWQCLTTAMASNASDFPLFAIYSLSDTDLISDTIAFESGSLVGHSSLVLRGSTGFPTGHISVPNILEADSDVGFAPAFKAVVRSLGPLVFGKENKILHHNLLHGCDTPGLQVECNQIVVCPLHSSSRKVMGFLALGINPHRPYDDEYKIFVRLLSRQIETQLSPILSLVKERIAAQINAQKSEYEQMLLTTQLEQQTLEARRSELRFLRFAEQAPVSQETN